MRRFRSDNSLVNWASSPAKHRFAVSIQCDAIALPFALFLARQIERREPDRNFDILVALNDRTCLPDKTDTSGLRLIALRPDPRITALPRTRHISHASYLWISLTEALDGVYDRVLFLDADMYLRRPGLSALFDDIPLPTPIMAAPDGVEYFQRGQTPTNLHVRDGLHVNHVFRNGGVELVDIARANAEGLPRQLLQARADLSRKLPSTDQAALNVLLTDKMALLSPIWNFMVRPWSEHLIPEIDPIMLHFANDPKPWISVDGLENSPYYSEYHVFLAQNFGPADLCARGLWGGETAPSGNANAFARVLQSKSNTRRSAHIRQIRHSQQNKPPCDFSVVQRYMAMSER